MSGFDIPKEKALALRSSVAVIGNKDTVLIFKALGMDVYYTDNHDAKEMLKDLIERNYHIILITEREAVMAGDILESLTDKPYPIVLPIPDGVSSLGLGMSRIEANIEKATGSLGGINE